MSSNEISTRKASFLGFLRKESESQKQNTSMKSLVIESNGANGSQRKLNELDTSQPKIYNFITSYKKEKIYLASILFNEKNEILTTKTGHLPSFLVYENDNSTEIFDNFTLMSELFLWSKQTSLDWSPCSINNDPLFSFEYDSLMDRKEDLEDTSQNNLKFRKEFLQSAANFQQSLNLSHFGIMHPSPIKLQNDNCILMISVVKCDVSNQFNNNAKSLGLNWTAGKKLSSSIYNCPQAKYLWKEYSNIYTKQTHPIESGLYVSVFECAVTVAGNGITSNFIRLIGPSLIIQKTNPTMLPIIKLRNKVMSDMEIEILRIALEDLENPEMNGVAMTSELMNSIEKQKKILEKIIGIPLQMKELVDAHPVKLSNDAEMLVFAHMSPLGVKPPPYDSENYEYLPMMLFEMIHFAQYDSETYSNYTQSIKLIKKAIKSKKPVQQSPKKTRPMSIIASVSSTSPSNEDPSQISLVSILEKNESTNDRYGIYLQKSVLELTNEIKEVQKKYSESRWTRPVLNTATLRTPAALASKAALKDDKEIKSPILGMLIF